MNKFNDKAAEAIFNGYRTPALPQHIQRAAYRKLRMLVAASSLKDLMVPPGNHLEKLSGDRSGQYSIRINDQYRICFEWIDNEAYNITFEDYH